MSNRATVTFHTSPDVKARLERLATATRRSKSFLTNEAVERYLADEEAFIAGVHEGLDQADAGQFVSTSDLKAGLHAAIDRKTKPSS